MDPVTQIRRRSGGPRLPDEVKKARGTFNSTRENKRKPQPATTIPRPPTWLTERQRQIFGSLTGTLTRMRIVSADDAHTIALLAKRLDEIEVYSKYVEEHGPTYNTYNQAGGLMIRVRPETTLLDKAMIQAHKLLRDFGMSPSSVNNVSVKVKEDEENIFATLLSKRDEDPDDEVESDGEPAVSDVFEDEDA